MLLWLPDESALTYYVTKLFLGETHLLTPNKEHMTGSGSYHSNPT